MKILIANPPCRIDIGNGYERYFVRSGSRWPFSVIKRKEVLPEYMPFPFYLAYSASLLLKEKCEVSVIDAVAMNLTLDDFIRESIRIRPDLVMFETTTPTIEHDLELAKRLKDCLSALIVLGGTHATVFPRQIMESVRAVDFILLGEYELNLLGLVRSLLYNTEISAVKGIVFRDNGNVAINPNPQQPDLDLLPFPARELFPRNGSHNINLYWDAFCQNQPAVQMHSSRGCPVRCNFCLWNQVIYGNGKYRMFSAKRVVDEMEHCIGRFGAKEIYFDDDSFTVDKNHVLGICREIINRKLSVKWSAMADVIFLDEEMLREMAKAGCIGIKFGIESGSREILQKIGKPVNFDKARRIAKSCADKRIKTHATFSFGLLGDNLDTINDTLNFAKDLDVDSVQFSITTPFPGTRYYDELNRENRIIAKDWLTYDGACSSVVRFNSFTREQLEEICSSALSVWLRHKIKNPRWLKRQMLNLFRLIKGQGVGAFIGKIKRIFHIIFKQ
jgi:radical SAM superfamily enzyme YgiQ (UPF0313 family)